MDDRQTEALLIYSYKRSKLEYEMKWQLNIDRSTIEKKSMIEISKMLDEEFKNALNNEDSNRIKKVVSLMKRAGELIGMDKVINIYDKDAMLLPDS